MSQVLQQAKRQGIELSKIDAFFIYGRKFTNSSSPEVGIGTSNTVISRWNQTTQQPEIIKLPNISIISGQNPPLIPSLVNSVNSYQLFKLTVIRFSEMVFSRQICFFWPNLFEYI